ncbi:hypothetical protein [Halopenitus persicus]|uniref:hypothetical protein n=1 Tax=Halopenitus persicus TaxID=1048396 RepID=UPI000B8376CE|nr:hypothetical protein [Halopenitus persicus]
MGAVRIDVTRLHDTWMEVAFPRQLDASSVLGKWQPETTPQRIAYKLWAAIGIPLVLFGYPLLLVGFATRYYATRLDSAVTRIGVLGVLLVATLVWGTLTVITRVQLSTEAFLAVGAASVVAIASAGLAALFSKVGGRATSVLLAYPFAMTALFLPPVVAALFTPSLGEVIFPNSTELAVWILDTLLAVGGINDWLRANFTLEGTGYVLMWFGLAIPTGWLLGLLVALADVIRPKQDD